MIQRLLIPVIKQRLGKEKAILIFGPRQVGKTTLLKQLFDQNNPQILWLNGDEADVKNLLADATSTRLKSIIGKCNIVIVDEAQRIDNIGLTIKLIVDNIKGVQVIATGSSSFELANRLQEPLTGRKYEFFLFPISFAEMVDHTGLLTENRLLEHRMVYGYYPEVVTKEGFEQEILSLLTTSYLYKDIFATGLLKKPSLLEKLVQALALQLGNEVSYSELGQLIRADNQTVERYVDFLEQSFIVFRLRSLSRNQRNEIKKSRKIYFYDNGIRNAIIKNFNPVKIRQDVGALWENFVIAERMKRNHYRGLYLNRYFWRTFQQQEIDYIEEYDGKLHAYDFKWSTHKKTRFPKTFLKAYPNSETKVISPENYIEFIT